MSDSPSGSHRYFRLPVSASLLSRALTGVAVLGTVAGLSLANGSAAVAATGGDGYNGVFLSEVYTHGADANNDVVADGDWIELFNSNSSGSVDLGGVILSDDENTHELVIPSGTSIPANSYMAFRTDAVDNTGDANFSLGDQDEARVFAPDSDVATATPADEFDWGHSPVHSWARDFAGSPGDPVDATWEASGTATPAASNVFTPATTSTLSGVKINEVNMNGGVHGDWIELYDDAPTGTAAVNLTGAILSDNDDTHAYVVGAQAGDTTSISPGGFATYQVDNAANNGNFGLGGSDSARLFTASTLDLWGNGTDPGVVTPPALGAGAPTVDSETWTTAPAFTLGRVPDGTGSFIETTGSTFDASNGSGTVPTHFNLSGVVINEVKTTGDPSHGDWVELLNTGSSTVNLSQAILSDNNDAHVIRINTGTMLAAGATLTITTDTDTDNPALTDPHATGDFGLGDADSARLFDADATDLAAGGTGVNAPVDSFSWTEHAATSWGRESGEDTPNTPADWAVTKNATYNVATNDFTNATDYTVNGTDNSGLNYIQVNEISSTDNTGDPIPGDDWVELINTAPVSININNMILSDSEDTHALTLSSTNTEVGNACVAPGTMGTTIPSGEFALILVDKSSYSGNFGLGSNDAIRLYAPSSTPGTSIPIDHNEWTAHPTGSYQRTDSGLGDWANGAINTQTPLEPNTGC